MEDAKIDVVVEHLDFDVIDEHLRTSTAVLHDIMGRDDEASNRQDPLGPNASGPESICNYCGKIYKSLSTLQKHLQLKHTNDEKKCNSCDKTYTSVLSLEQHVRYMHRKHRCSVCYKTFETSQSLMVHGEACKKIETACTFCGNIYASAVSLRNHVKYKHPATKKHWCKTCRREFVSDTHLINHRYTNHPEGATVCRCGKGFTSVSALQSHVLYKHTEMNARCQHCHKAFVTRSSLKRHLMKVHSIDMAGCSDIKTEIDP